jgi:hypothetical protein
MNTEELAAQARAGMWGNQHEAQVGEEAVTALVAKIDQLEAELARWHARYGEEVVDPLTELRMRMQR